MIQIERALQQEVVLRLSRFPLIVLPIPNSLWIPTRSPAEKSLAARIVKQMKSYGMLTPGAPDLAVLWGYSYVDNNPLVRINRPGSGCLELKRPASSDLLTRRPAGRPSETQKAFAERARELGINHGFATSWEEVRSLLIRWGAPVE